MSKRATLLLITALAVSSLIAANLAIASASQLPVPEFTLKYVDNSYDVPSYDVPPTYGIDPYTGKNVTIREGHHVEGYHVENKSIEVWIKNQNLSNSSPNLFYNVRYKGHFGEDWTALRERIPAFSPYWNSEYTVVTCSADYPNHAQLDFQVEAVLGHYYETYNPIFVPFYVKLTAFKIDATSGWSNTQTITLDLVKLLSPRNGNFSTSDVPLVFAVNQPVSRIQYSLDGKEKVTVSGNTTLTGLPNGYHNVTVYATDESGNTGASETVSFNVEVPETFPVALVAAASTAIAIAVGVGLLVYFKKHRQEAGQS